MVSSSDAATTLYEALTLWRQSLESQESQQDSTLPRKGKNPATSSDEELERQRRIHLETVERCLKVVPEMAAVITKQPKAMAATDSAYTAPPAPPPDPEMDRWELEPAEYRKVFGAFFDQEDAGADDEPFLNPFTGQMVFPASSKYTAGPSGTCSPPNVPSPRLFLGAGSAHAWPEEEEDEEEEEEEEEGNNYSWPMTKPESRPSRYAMPTEPDTDWEDDDYRAPRRTYHSSSSKHASPSSSPERDGFSSSGINTPPSPEEIQPAFSGFQPIGTRPTVPSFANSTRTNVPSFNDYSSDSDDDGPLPVAGAIHKPGPPTPPPKVPVILTASTPAPVASSTRNPWGSGPRPPYPTTPFRSRIQRAQPATRPTFASRAEEDFGNVFGTHWGGLDHHPVPEPTTDAQREFSSSPYRQTNGDCDDDSSGDYGSEDDDSDDIPSEEKEQARPEAQYAADLAYAAHLARADLDSDDDYDSDEDTDEEYARLVEEQRSLLAEFELHGGKAQIRRERDMAHARWMQEQEDRIMQEQEAVARRVRDEWAAAFEAQMDSDRLLAEQWDREEEEEDNRLRMEYEELKRKIEEEEQERIRVVDAERERIRREMVSECVVCTEEYDKTDMIILSCEHAYCVSVDCLKAPFNIALKDKKPFTCCSQRVDIGLAGTHITPEFVASYRLMLLELDTPNPLYCPAPNCSSFIPPAGIRGDTGSCPKCATAVCRHCRKASHSGICTEDKEGQMVRNLVKQQRWMECPKCKTVVERKEGCLHMTCRCSAEFCYSCGVLYGDKPGQCLGNCNRK